jgi:hypothetical protein
MNFPEQTKAMKKSNRKALVFEDGGTPASFRAFGQDGFWPGKIISLDFLGSVFYQEKTNANADGTAFKKTAGWTSSENSLGGAANTMYSKAPGPKGKLIKTKPTYHLTGGHTLPWTNIGTATTSGATTVQYTSTGSGVSQVFNPPAGERIYVDLEVITTQSAVQITITDMSTSLPVATTSVPGWANSSPTLSFFSSGTSYEIKLIGTTPAVYPDYFGISRLDVRTWTKPFQPGMLYVSNLDIETNLPVTDEIIYITKLDFTEVTITTSEVCGNVEVGYDYGYNTQEAVNEIKGPKNHYTAPFWEYDPRAVMRWNVDPKGLILHLALIQ